MNYNSLYHNVHDLLFSLDSFSNNKANQVFSKANHVFSKANQVFSKANHVFSKANQVFSKANHVFSKANHVFSKANQVFSKANQVFSLSLYSFITIVKQEFSNISISHCISISNMVSFKIQNLVQHSLSGA